MFFITFGLVNPQLIEDGSLGYFLLMTPFVLVQAKTIQVFVRLVVKLLFKPGLQWASA